MIATTIFSTCWWGRRRTRSRAWSQRRRPGIIGRRRRRARRNTLGRSAGRAPSSQREAWAGIGNGGSSGRWAWKRRLRSPRCRQPGRANWRMLLPPVTTGGHRGRLIGRIDVLRGGTGRRNGRRAGASSGRSLGTSGYGMRNFVAGTKGRASDGGRARAAARRAVDAGADAGGVHGRGVSTRCGRRRFKICGGREDRATMPLGDAVNPEN